MSDRGDSNYPSRGNARDNRSPGSRDGAGSGEGKRFSGSGRPNRDGTPVRRPRDGASFTARKPNPRSQDRRPSRGDDSQQRNQDPRLPDNVEPTELPDEARRDLLALDKTSADLVARHLVVATQLLEEDPARALAHARAARRRASRIAMVRETAGIAAYYAGEWAEALNELRTARRIGGGSGLLAVMADCERGLGRPERAIEIARSPEARSLPTEAAIELRIVAAGARMDLEQYDAAVVTLQGSDLDNAREGATAARLCYAYAEALLAAGRRDEALSWFFRSSEADSEATDAEDRAVEMSEADPDIV
nr:hypothetical protein [Hoyosella altamirensis]